MAEVADNPRDRAFILVLYESGCRIGEILSLKIRNVQFDDYGAQLIVNGKTGSRRVRILFSQAELASWMNIHPLRNDLDAPLWITLGTKSRNSFLTHNAAYEILKENAKRAGIKKRIYPHLFRHSRATHLANFLTEAQMKQYFGWVQNSSMAVTYVHLSGRDVDNALLKIQGIDMPEEKKEPKLKVITCIRCDEKNSPSSKFCVKCGSPLNLETAFTLDELRAKADRLLSILVKKPEVLEKLLEKIEELE
jgi:integrase/ribosomal protein L40E